MVAEAQLDCRWATFHHQILPMNETHLIADTNYIYSLVLSLNLIEIHWFIWVFVLKWSSKIDAFVCLLFQTPFRYFSPYEYLVISLPDTPHVPMPTRPFTLSGDAKILLILVGPAFFPLFAVKLIHLFFSVSRSSSISLNLCCLRSFFFFRYSLLLCRWRLKIHKEKV